MRSRDVPFTRRVGVLAGGGECPPHPDIADAGVFFREPGVYASSDDFRHGDAQPAGAAFYVAMPGLIELYLKTHHDGMTIPS